MNSYTAARLLLVAAVAIPLLTCWTVCARDRHAEHWAEHVAKACTSRRYGMRLAAARKVANAGDAAVPAVEAYVREHGQAQLPCALVDAIADSGRAGPRVSRLLHSWATNSDFFWRASAMRGLALRLPNYGADAAENCDRAQLVSLMNTHARHDPARLVRTHARFGLALDGAPLDELFAMPEADPRARVRLAALLVREGRVPPMQPLIDALADERTFLGARWGQRLASEADDALRFWLGDERATGGDARGLSAAISARIEVVERKTGQSLTMPPRRTDRVPQVAGGFELLSCKNGDQFVQWAADGCVYFGLDGACKVTLPPASWQQLIRDRAAIELEHDVGVAVCDHVRLCLPGTRTNVRVAPASMPPAAMDWLLRLALAVEQAGADELAEHLWLGLQQFAMHARPAPR